MENRYIKLTKKNQVAFIELNRSEKHNAIDLAVLQEFHSVLDTISYDTSLAAIVISGNGSSFCAGADIKWFQSTLSLSDTEQEKQYRLLAELFKRLYEIALPTIAVIHGNTIGGGLGIVAACDFVLAVEDTTMAFREVRLGIIPATIAPFLIRKIGANHSRQLMILGRNFSAQEGKNIGLITEVVKNKDLDLVLESWLQQIRKNSPMAMRQTKNLIRQLELTGEELALCIQSLQNAIKSKDGKEGFLAFQQKRTPQWENEKTENEDFS